MMEQLSSSDRPPRSAPTLGDLVSATERLCYTLRQVAANSTLDEQTLVQLTQTYLASSSVEDAGALHSAIGALYRHLEPHRYWGTHTEYFIKNIEEEIALLKSEAPPTPSETIRTDLRRRLFSHNGYQFHWEEVEYKDDIQQRALLTESARHEICAMVYALPKLLGDSPDTFEKTQKDFLSFSDIVIGELNKQRYHLQDISPVKKAFDALINLTRAVDGAVVDFTKKALPVETFESLKIITDILVRSHNALMGEIAREPEINYQRTHEKTETVREITESINRMMTIFHTTGGTNSFSDSPKKVGARTQACNVLFKGISGLRDMVSSESGDPKIQQTLLIDRRDIQAFLKSHLTEIEEIQRPRIADVGSSDPANGLGRLVPVTELEEHLKRYGGMVVLHMKGETLLGYSLFTFPDDLQLSEVIPNAPKDLEGPIAVMELTVARGDTQKQIKADWGDETLDAYRELTDRSKRALFALGFRSAICSCRTEPLNTAIYAHERVGWIRTGNIFSYEASGRNCTGEVLSLNVRNSVLYRFFNGDWASIEP